MLSGVNRNSVKRRTFAPGDFIEFPPVGNELNHEENCS